jgi:hypothetical protein
MKSLITKRRKQNHKISFQFFAAPPCTPAVLKGKVRKFLVLVRDWKEREARSIRTTTKSERTERFQATTRSARAKLIKILQILLIQCSNFVQETPPIFTFARNGRMWSVAKRHRMPRTRYTPRFFQAHGERALGDVEVRLSKSQSPEVSGQPILLFALSSDVKRFLTSIVQKLSFQYKYE